MKEKMKDVNVARERKKMYKEPSNKIKSVNVPISTDEKEALVKGDDLPISTKHCIAICSFIKNKTPDETIRLLTEVIRKKIAVPMKGEIPHKKGIAGGRYPLKASKYFIKLIRNVVANANVKGMDINKLVIYGIANKGTTFSHSGRKRGKFKRTNIIIIAKEKERK